MLHPSLRSTSLAVGLPVLLIAAACTSNNTVRSGGGRKVSGAEQAEAVRNAQENARQAAVENLYAEWRLAQTNYQSGLQTLEAQAAAQRAQDNSGPVRSLEELLRETAPELHDPAARELHQRWLEESTKFDSRLRQLNSDPDQDPRSPLVALKAAKNG